MKFSINQNRSTVKHFGKLFVPLLFVSLFSVSCGSSGGGGSPSAETSEAVDLSKGVITQSDANSISVNGVAFNTENARVTIDDQPGNRDELRTGMLVEINGRIDDDGRTGEAEQIRFDSEIKGPIDRIDAANNSFVVLGRTIIVDNNTRIVDENDKRIAFSLLMENDMLEVSGLTFTDGTIQATHIEKKSEFFVDDLSEVELKGIVKMLDIVAKTFLISDQIIDYNGVIQFKEMRESDLREGLRVEVEGTRDGNGILNATKIKKEDHALDADENEEVEIEAVVTDFTSATSFALGEQAVNTDENTRFEGGAADDIALNVRLEVEGRMNASGVLVAKKIEFKGNRIKIEADVENIDPLNNTITLLGQTVLINGATETEDDSSDERGDFPFSDIGLGDRLKISAYLSNGVITATKIERKNPTSEVKLQGPITLGSNSEFKILSVTVFTSGSTRFEGRSRTSLSESDFFSQINNNDVVKVKGRFSSGDIFAEEIEIED